MNYWYEGNLLNLEKILIKLNEEGLIGNKDKIFVKLTKEDLDKKDVLSRLSDFEIGVWPLFPEKGYWISSYNVEDAKEDLFEILKGLDVNDIVLDLEPPKQFLDEAKKGKIYFFKYKRKEEIIKLINYLSKKYNLICCIPDICLESKKLLNFCGIPNLEETNVEVNVMSYSSIYQKFLPRRAVERRLYEILRMAKKKFSNVSVSLGLIYPGVFGNEPIYGKEELVKDIAIAKNFVNEIYVYELRGLHKVGKVDNNIHPVIPSSSSFFFSAEKVFFKILNLFL